jgi:hypothetical protein
VAIIPRRRLGVPRYLLAFALLAACSSTNTIGPGNQLQVGNLTDDFQFQVTALSNVSQTLTYTWANTGDSANVNQASSLTGGSATLTIRGPTGTLLYQTGLQNNGTYHTQKGTVGNWQIQVVLDKAGGALNFRVQKAP